jgi:geranylgeranyl pyrophosphate synthase
MQTDESLMEEIKNILIEHSKNAMSQAKQAVANEQITFEPLREALRFFMEEFWFDASHPALLSLTCEAVGGQPESTSGIGSALVLLAGAADIHDDIIDESKQKDGKPTVYGKFGLDMAIIAADVLWFKGMLLLSEACDQLTSEKKNAILKLAKEAFFSIGSAEAEEASQRRNLDLEPQKYFEIISLKASVAAAAAQIGAIVGNGTPEQIENLGEYGRVLGTLMTIRDEFIDMFEQDELTNRYKNECLPLPVLYALQDVPLKKEIIAQFACGEMTDTQLEKILDLVTNAPIVKKLITEMVRSKQAGISFLSSVKADKRKTLVKVLESSLQGLEDK